MKKLNKIMWIGILLVPSLVWSAGGLEDGIDMVAETSTLFGMLIVVISVSLWMLPIAFAGLVYTGQKKKAEQMHEEVGLKASILSLLAGVLGAAMAFYIVGTIGAYSDKSNSNFDLKEGNKFLLNAIIGKAVDQIGATAKPVKPPKKP